MLFEKVKDARYGGADLEQIGFAILQPIEVANAPVQLEIKRDKQRGPVHLIRSVARQDDLYSATEKVHVEPGRPVADVIRIERHAFGIGGVVASGDLPEAGDSGKNL